MCVSVAFTAGCTFSDVAEATKAASNAQLSASENCVSVLFTAGCSFDSVAEAQAAAQPHLDAMAESAGSCGKVMFTAVCSV